jgi:hypothetical protein
MNKLITFSTSAIIICTFCFFAIPVKTESALPPEGFAVVELFTSEGCSSCPPADEAVIQLAKDYPEHVYVLAYHVDYWDYIGWKDEFSSAAFTERQRKYGERFSLSSVYTPQIIVNGEKEFVGSNRAQLSSSVKKALQTKGSGEVKMSLAKENANNVRVTYEVNGTEPAILNLALVQRNAVTAVKRGENKGKSLHHINIVRAFKAIPINKSAKAVIALPLPPNLSFKDVEVIAFLQNNKSWKIQSATAQSIE